jgi:O-antigen ligase
LGAGLLGLILLLPALAQPTLAIALVGLVGAVWLASKSVAYPLALAGIPAIVEAITGSNPLPKGGITFLFAAWIGIAVLFAVTRGTHEAAGRALLSAPVVLSVALLGVMLLGLGTSPDEAYGSTKLHHYIADNLVFLLGAIYVGSRRSDLRLFFLVTLAVAGGEALLLMLKLVSGGGAGQETLQNRISLSAQEYPIYLARSAADGLVIAIYAVLAAARNWTQMGAIAMIPLLAVAMLAAGSRGPVVAFLIGVITLIALTAASRRARRRLLLATGGLILAAGVAAVVVPGATISRSLSTLLGSASGLSSNGRSALWAQAYTAFGAHPFLGLGWGAFASLNSTEPYPHNLILEMAVELGFVGVLLILAIVASLTSRLVSAWRATSGRDKLDAAVLITLFVTALINAFFSGAVQDNKEIWVWGGLGVGMSARLALQRRSARRMRFADPGRPAPPLTVEPRAPRPGPTAA